MFFKKRAKKLNQKQLVVNWWLLNQGFNNESGVGRNY